jgi:hypothetical protein
MAKRGNPTKNANDRKALRDLNDEEYAAEVVKPERDAIMKRGNAGLAAGAGMAGAGGLGEGNVAAFGGGLGLIGATAISHSSASNKLNKAEKRIRLTKPLIDDAKAKNAELRKNKK